eukprot:SAG31_NODE_7944_length_1557_cov_3.304527_2_plen_195_part_00
MHQQDIESRRASAQQQRERERERERAPKAKTTASLHDQTATAPAFPLHLEAAHSPQLQGTAYGMSLTRKFIAGADWPTASSVGVRAGPPASQRGCFEARPKRPMLHSTPRENHSYPSSPDSVAGPTLLPPPRRPPSTDSGEAPPEEIQVVLLVEFLCLSHLRSLAICFVLLYFFVVFVVVLRRAVSGTASNVWL